MRTLVLEQVKYPLFLSVITILMVLFYFKVVDSGRLLSGVSYHELIGIITSVVLSFIFGIFFCVIVVLELYLSFKKKNYKFRIILVFVFSYFCCFFVFVITFPHYLLSKNGNFISFTFFSTVFLCFLILEIWGFYNIWIKFSLRKKKRKLYKFEKSMKKGEKKKFRKAWDVSGQKDEKTGFIIERSIPLHPNYYNNEDKHLDIYKEYVKNLQYFEENKNDLIKEYEGLWFSLWIKDTEVFFTDGICLGEVSNGLPIGAVISFGIDKNKVFCQEPIDLIDFQKNKKTIVKYDGTTQIDGSHFWVNCRLNFITKEKGEITIDVDGVIDNGAGGISMSPILESKLDKNICVMKGKKYVANIEIFGLDENLKPTSIKRERRDIAISENAVLERNELVLFGNEGFLFEIDYFQSHEPVPIITLVDKENGEKMKVEVKKIPIIEKPPNGSNPRFNRKKKYKNKMFLREYFKNVK